MDIAAFCGRLADPAEKFRSRFLTGVSPSGETDLLSAYGEGFEKIEIAGFVRGARYVIAPPALFQDLDGRFDAVRATGKIPVVVGLDAYLGLVDRENRKQAFSYLLRFANKQGRETTIAILRGNWPEMREVFANPSLLGNDWLSFSSGGPDIASVTLLPRRFAGKFGGAAIPSLSEWLGLHAAGLKAGDKATVEFNGAAFPGLDGAHVAQAPDARSFLGAFCSFQADAFTDPECEWILAETETLETGKELARRFFPEGLATLPVRALSRFGWISAPMERSVFLKFVASHADPDGYLARAIRRSATDGSDFETRYLRSSKEDVEAHDAVLLAKERASAVKALDPAKKIVVETAQEGFIADASNLADAQIAPWLGLGLPCEEKEWTRRHMAGSVDAAKRSRFLRAYLENVGTGVSEVDVYFRAYRERKAANRIDEDFCRIAAGAEVPGSELDDRDGEIKKIAADQGACLLVVDGLGAEWLPFLVALANEHGVRIESAKCAVALLPTSTEFNPTAESWGESDRYRKIDDLDKIYHKQGLRSEDGLCMEFEQVENVLKEARERLLSFERVVVTADHGASRLATLAYEAKLAQTLKPGEDGVPGGIAPEKWRFAAVPDGAVVSSPQLETDLSGGWAAVKGYGRFSISGGPTFELHGGATLEERLVPFIVFGRGFSAPFAQAEAKAATAAQDGGQIEEDSDFDL